MGTHCVLAREQVEGLQDSRPAYSDTGLCIPLSAWQKTGTDNSQEVLAHDEIANLASARLDSRSHVEVPSDETPTTITHSTQKLQMMMMMQAWSGISRA